MPTVNAIPTQLLDPACYPWPVRSVDLIETHLSWVFLAGSRVIKVRRPVAFPFVDQRDLEQRHQICLDDIRLNRRLSTDVYLRVEPITSRGEGVVIGGSGEALEWCSVMRRLPKSALLTHQIASSDLQPHSIDRLADHLASFHLACEPCCSSRRGTCSTADVDVVRDNLVELEPFAGRLLSISLLGCVTDAMTAFMEQQSRVFADRADSGWVRDGHGDLRAEHVFLEEDGRIQVIDCVEFSHDIRCADVASDLAFLLMDLRRLDRADLAEQIVDRYRSRGIPLPPGLLRFYQAHRALVRAKINALTLDRGGLLDHHVLAAELTDYTALALQMVSTIEPALVVMTGLSGTGKSTVAKRVSRILGARHVRSDVIRKELAGPSAGWGQAWETGIYTPDWTTQTYRALFEQAENDLGTESPVVLDASFLEQQWRDEAVRLGLQMGVPVVFLVTECDSATVLQRLETRNAIGDDPSDADLGVYQAQLEALERNPLRFPPGADCATIDTALPAVTWIDAALDVLQRTQIVRARW